MALLIARRGHWVSFGVAILARAFASPFCAMGIVAWGVLSYLLYRDFVRPVSRGRGRAARRHRDGGLSLLDILIYLAAYSVAGGLIGVYEIIKLFVKANRGSGVRRYQFVRSQ